MDLIFLNEVTTLVLWVFSNGFDSPGQTTQLTSFFQQAKQTRVDSKAASIWPSVKIVLPRDSRMLHLRQLESFTTIQDLRRVLSCVSFFVKNEKCFKRKKIMFTGKNREIVGKDS